MFGDFRSGSGGKSYGSFNSGGCVGRLLLRFSSLSSMSDNMTVSVFGTLVCFF
jgi:hypothetical protein